MNLIDINKAAYHEQVINAKGAKLVVFWAPWAGPCHVLLDTLEDYKHKVFKEAYLVNLDDEMEVGRNNSIRVVPTLLVFNNGEPISARMGELKKEHLDEWLNSL